MVVGIGHFVQRAAVSGHMIVERWIGPIGGHHVIARTNEQPHQISKQSIDPFAHHDVGWADPVMGGERGAQGMIFGVWIVPDIGLCHRVKRARRRAEVVFIGPEPCCKGRAAGAFLCFGPDKGHSGGQAGGQRRKAKICHIKGVTRVLGGGKDLAWFSAWIAQRVTCAARFRWHEGP